MFISMDINNIKCNPNQPRKVFNENALQELANSIVSDGLQEPILVRPKGNDTYEIVQGERRYKAHILAGLEVIDVKIRELDDKEAFHLGVIENIQREQLSPLEEAQAYYHYVELGFTHEQIAKKISKSRDHVTSRLRLLKLVPFIHDWIAEGYISEGHAKQILKLEGILERFLKYKPISKFLNEDGSKCEKSHFEEFQWRFHSAFWEKHHNKDKITVNEVKEWVDGWRYAFIESTILVYKGIGNCVVALKRGFPLTAELDCNVYHLHISNIIEEDIDFAVTYEMERYKDEWTKDFRPWMVEKYWDDIRNEMFYSNENLNEKWKLNGKNCALEKAILYRDMLEDQSLEIIERDIKYWSDRLEEVSCKLGMTVEELIDDMMMTNESER